MDKKKASNLLKQGLPFISELREFVLNQAKKCVLFSHNGYFSG